MGTTKLEVFNGALGELGERRLSDTGEPVESARALLDRWSRVVADCLEAGMWNFATETVKLVSDTGVTPNFGYQEVFAKPTDWVKTIAVSQDEYFSVPEIHYYDDVNFWSADYSPIYARYVSNDTGMGLDLTKWPARFTRFVELELAERVCMRLTQNASLKEQIMKDKKDARKAAKNSDAMDEAQPKFFPQSSWGAARGGRLSRGDRGSRSNLTG